MKNLKLISFAFLFLGLACDRMDLVGQNSLTSFQALLQNKQLNISDNADYWLIKAPGVDNYIFAMSKDFAKPVPHFYFLLSASDFIMAGTNLLKLSSQNISFDPGALEIKITFQLENKTIKGEKNILESYIALLAQKREVIGYHEQFDHYGIALNGGNMFEWAKNLATNDKDLVFVLNPEPFLKAGLDPAKLTRWVYGAVRVTDEKGVEKEVYKLLKPFNL